MSVKNQNNNTGINTNSFSCIGTLLAIIFGLYLMFLAGLIIPRQSVTLGIGNHEVGTDGIRYENKATLARKQMKEIVKSLHLYKFDNGVYPTTEQGLLALVVEQSRKPKPRKWRQYLDKFPYDPWDEPYLYKCPGTKHEKNAAGYQKVNSEIYNNFVLTCRGADGIEGTKDDIRTFIDEEQSQKDAKPEMKN